MISNKVKDGKLREYCIKCNKHLHFPSKEGICQTCKVKSFDKKANQKNKLQRYFK